MLHFYLILGGRSLLAVKWLGIMEPIELIVLVVFLGIIAKLTIVDKLPIYWSEFKSGFVDIGHFFTSWKTIALTLLICYPLILWLGSILSNFLSDIYWKRKNAQNYMENERSTIQGMQYIDLEELTLESAKQLIERIEEKIRLAKDNEHLTDLEESLDILLEHAENRLKELKHEKRLEEIHREKRETHEEVERLKKEREEIEQKKSDRVTAIWGSLNADEINVFLKEDLESYQIDALLKNDFNHVTEYCVLEKKFINVLLKRTMHHSETHTFLVWSVGRLLESLPKISHIIEHDTRDTDITFKCKKETYALEIETGTLLSKKHQLHAKVSYLNRTYPGRWMFIVSNKNLASKYSEFGPASTRKDVEKKLTKMLKVAT